MNNVTLIGRSTREPELKYIPSTGNAVATFSIAVDRDFTGKEGKKLTDFFNIVVWGKSAERCSKYLGKGKLVAIKGNIQNKTYETKEGEKRYITEIVSERLQILEWEKNNTEDAQSFKPDEYSQVDFDESEVPF
ncbi:single-strand DNA-binding protein [Acetoanaerobium noterae]|uniref:Single-stranded DNA-binding protein n=1 Tax=Acetoanaerobium noterae TaxID=745369 RepID=A0A1T5ALJ5_9FIRM|nr:single-stranded DNA-binding protein [Acetoanaerobium noterae]SKB35755.1 single-strand DNA-binding protein [Acetoanaerobium noterae]